MKNNNIKFWAIVVIVALVAGVLGAVVSNGITGNVISVAKGKAGKVYTTSETYSKTETDKRISDAIKNVLDNVIADEVLEPILRLQANHTGEVLDVLNKCSVIKDGQQSGVISCNTICARTNTICVDADYQGTLRPCSDSSGSINTDRFCKCCVV